MNAEPRTLSQRTIARRLREAYALRQGSAAVLPDVVLEAADELDRLTRRPDIGGAPTVDLFDALLELGDATAESGQPWSWTERHTVFKGAHEIARLRQIIRDLIFECESHQIPNRTEIRIIVPARLHEIIRNEARRP